MKITRIVAIMVTTALVAVALGVGTQAFAADRVRQHDRLKDGSCQLAADRVRQHDRLKDGSCQLVADATRTRERDRVRDGSCGTAAPSALRDRARTRTRLHTAPTA